MVSRRNFIALASGLLVPWQPERVYSFLPAWRLLHRHFVEALCTSKGVQLDRFCRVDKAYGSEIAFGFADGRRGEIPNSEQIWVAHPAVLLDLQKSADAFGYPRPVIL